MVSRVRVVDMVFENRISQIRENAAWTQCEVIVLVNNLITQEIKTYRIRPKVLMIPMYVLHWKNLQVFGLYELSLEEHWSSRTAAGPLAGAFDRPAGFWSGRELQVGAPSTGAESA